MADVVIASWIFSFLASISILDLYCVAKKPASNRCRLRNSTTWRNVEEYNYE